MMMSSSGGSVLDVQMGGVDPVEGLSLYTTRADDMLKIVGLEYELLQTKEELATAQALVTMGPDEQKIAALKGRLRILQNLVKNRLKEDKQAVFQRITQMSQEMQVVHAHEVNQLRAVNSDLHNALEQTKKDKAALELAFKSEERAKLLAQRDLAKMERTSPDEFRKLQLALAETKRELSEARKQPADTTLVAQAAIGRATMTLTAVELARHADLCRYNAEKAAAEGKIEALTTEITNKNALFEQLKTAFERGREASKKLSAEMEDLRRENLALKLKARAADELAASGGVFIKQEPASGV